MNEVDTQVLTFACFKMRISHSWYSDYALKVIQKNFANGLAHPETQEDIEAFVTI